MLKSCIASIARGVTDMALTDHQPPYCEQVQTAVEPGLFDTIGHLDLPKRYASAEADEYDPLRNALQLKPVFQAIIDHGISFEINTSGLRQSPWTSMPGLLLVDFYVSMGGRTVTIGSDSHVADTIGAGYERTLDMLHMCGNQTVSSFRARTRNSVPLADLRPHVRSS